MNHLTPSSIQYILFKHYSIISYYVSICNIVMTIWSWYSWHYKPRSWTDSLYF